jgi:hypothetical protein
MEASGAVPLVQSVSLPNRFGSGIHGRTSAAGPNADSSE